MPLELLSDENVPWPLVKRLRLMGLNILWIPETDHRGISDSEIVNLANKGQRAILTRDSDFLKSPLRRRAKYGIIYIGEPVRKDNIEKLASNIKEALHILTERRVLIIVTAWTIETYPLEQ